MHNEPPVILQERTFRFGRAMAIYRIETEQRGRVFMRVDRSNYFNDERAVVVVDASRFLSAWRADCGPAWLRAVHAAVDPITRALNQRSPKRDRWLPYLSRKSWLRDYKFQEAVEGFAQGAENPVPLAKIGLSWGTPGAVVFRDGITRTLWLLANGASAFPVECEASIADTLSQAVGVEWAYPQTVQELLGAQFLG